MTRLDRFKTSLDALAKKDRLRRLAPRTGLDFASNDYVGLAGSRRLRAAMTLALERGVPVGAAGSRLLRGNHPEHEALESEAASFFGAEKALFFGAGFSANVALIQTLPQRGDLLVHDELVHASVHDGLKGCRAEIASAAHNDAQAVEDAIRAWRERGGKGQPFVAVESLYSMDGDCAPVADLVDIVERHDGFLLLDEAHATGVHGPNGRGLGEAFEGREALIFVHTCGKALGCSGALVTGPAAVIDFLVNRARPFIYATAPSPAVAAAVREALRIVADEPERRAALARRCAIASDRLERLGLPDSGTQIQPVVLGPASQAVALAGRLRAAGFDCRAIRPPTVPEGTSRLRISLTLNVDEDMVSALIDVMAEALVEVAA